MNYDELMDIAVSMGQLLLQNGAEIYRVEESMQHILRAYNVQTGHIFAIPTCINATLTTPDGRAITVIRRVYNRQMHLDKVSRANALCRRIAREKPPLEEVRGQMAQIDGMPIYGMGMQVLAFALTAAAFTLFFGGTVADALVSAVCGLTIRLSIYRIQRLGTNTFFINIIASFVAASIAFVAARLAPQLSADKMIIGALMNLVPGIAITSFMRDIIAGDLMAGMIRLMESLLVAAAIAIGSGVALGLVRVIWGV